MLFRKLINLKSSTFVLTTLCSSLLWAVEAPVFIGLRHNIPKAIRLEITPKGQVLFQQKLSSVLGNLAVSLDEGYFPSQTIHSDKDIDLDEVAKTQPEAVAMYRQISTLLTQWLTGFSLNPSRPAIEVGDSGYIASFSKFGLVTDTKLMKQLGFQNGAILAVELEINELTLATNSIKAWDMNNEFLGNVSLEDVTIKAGTPENKIKVRLPFYVRMTSEGLLDFQVLDIEQNIDQTDISIAYKKLLTPQMGVIVNGKTYYMNNKELEKYVENQVPVIIEKVREHIGDFAKKQLPDILNQKVKEKVSGKIEQIQSLDAPGAEANDTRPPLIMGITLSELNLQDSLNIGLDAFIEDSVNPRSNVAPLMGSRGPVLMNALPKSSYDLALSIDRLLINRIMQLSFERRNFEKISQSDGTSLKLTTPPLFDYVQAPPGTIAKPDESFFKLNVSIETQPDSMFLDKTIVVNIDIIAKMRPSKTAKGFEIVLYKIDTGSLKMDKAYLSFAGKMVEGLVYKGIRDHMNKICAGWLIKEEVLSGTLPLPPEIMGIQTDLVKLTMEKNGFLVVYLNYAASNGVAK